MVEAWRRGRIGVGSGRSTKRPSSEEGQRDLGALRPGRSGVVHDVLRAVARHHPNPSSEEEGLKNATVRSLLFVIPDLIRDP